MRAPPDSSPITARFGRNLRRLRKETGLSQEGLARITELHRPEVSLLERGDRMLRLDTLIRLVSSLAVSADALLDGIEWVRPSEKPAHGSTMSLNEQLAKRNCQSAAWAVGRRIYCWAPVSGWRKARQQ